MSESTTPMVHKFRQHLPKNLLGFLFAWLLFTAGVLVGIWDIVDPFILETEEVTVGIALVLVGMFVPPLFLKLLKWDGEMLKDFYSFSWGFIFVLVPIALFLFLDEVSVALVWVPLYGVITLLVGALFMAIGFLLAPKHNKKGVPKWRFGAFAMFFGNVLVILAAYGLIGGLLTI